MYKRQAYAVGSKGINVDDDLAFDFVVATSEGSERIAKMAYEYCLLYTSRCV